MKWNHLGPGPQETVGLTIPKMTLASRELTAAEVVALSDIYDVMLGKFF